MHFHLSWQSFLGGPRRLVSLAEDETALGTIRVSGLVAGYGADAVFDGFDLDVAAGEFVYVIGPSGAGKSTLFRVLFGSVRPNGGAVSVDGVRLDGLRSWHLSRFRRRVGCVFQGYELLPQLTALENVLLPLALAHPELKDPRDYAADALGLVGLGGKLGARPRELSGGQQQRVAIARAVAHEPRILLADEPTGNIDRRSSEEVVDIFRQLNALGSTVVMSTHDDYVRHFHRARTVTIQPRLRESAA